jgi:hypothetical protein
LVTGEYPGKGKKPSGTGAPGWGMLPARQKDSVDGRTRRGKKNRQERSRAQREIIRVVSCARIRDRAGAKAEGTLKVEAPSRANRSEAHEGALKRRMAGMQVFVTEARVGIQSMYMHYATAE